MENGYFCPQKTSNLALLQHTDSNAEFIGAKTYRKMNRICKYKIFVVLLCAFSGSGSESRHRQRMRRQAVSNQQSAISRQLEAISSKPLAAFRTCLAARPV